MGLLLLLFFLFTLGSIITLAPPTHAFSYITFGLHVICSGINSRTLLFKRFKSVSFLFWEAFHKGFSLEKLLNS